MTSLPERILKLAERGIDDRPIEWLRGQADENTRLLPLIKSLAEIIEKQSEALAELEQTFIRERDKESIMAQFISRASKAQHELKARLKELGIE